MFRTVVAMSMFALLLGCFEPTRSVSRYTYSLPSQQTVSTNQDMSYWMGAQISKVILK